MDFDLILYLVFAIPGFLIELVKQLVKIYVSLSTVSPSKSKDHGTFFFIWLTVLCSAGISIHYIHLGYGYKIFTSYYSRFVILFPLSVSCLVAGQVLRKQSIQQLGKWFTMTILINDDQQLIESGWYGKMRHPSYTGVLMVFFGLGLVMNNWVGLVGTIVPATLIFLYRIRVEERELQAHFRLRYDEYRQKVSAKLIPYIF